VINTQALCIRVMMIMTMTMLIQKYFSPDETN